MFPSIISPIRTMEEWTSYRFSLTESQWGRVTTLERSNMGAYWDEFLRSGQVGEWRELEAGDHTLTLTVIEADKFGVEVDAIVVEMDAVNVIANNIRCAGSSFKWGDNSGIGNGCNPSDEVKTVKTTGRGGVSSNLCKCCND
ncbi:uncharacterized protein LOC124267049 [Haliotis rubra]|uniref:uncharacterized protein LOC124267049 n=1 Tax=Haliotis rubra TaxID=36100 RepID=UPI001EE58E63|nr:uncharacterized protein LOC124267049 [Haliotis rubra]